MKQTWQTLLVTLVAGALVWAFSPGLTGQRQPWDAAGIYYPVALFAAGVVAGLLTPQPLWAHYLGGGLGQLGYMVIVLGVGPLLLAGLVFMLVYTLIWLVGAFLAGQLRRLI